MAANPRIRTAEILYYNPFARESGSRRQHPGEHPDDSRMGARNRKIHYLIGPFLKRLFQHQAAIVIYCFGGQGQHARERGRAGPGKNVFACRAGGERAGVAAAGSGYGQALARIGICTIRGAARQRKDRNAKGGGDMNLPRIDRYEKIATAHPRGTLRKSGGGMDVNPHP
jgi:hypothetical protein